MKAFAYSPFVHTTESQPDFNSPFVCGVSLISVHPAKAKSVNALFDTLSVSESEAVAKLVTVVQQLTSRLADCRARLESKVQALGRMVADAASLADLPADIASDRQTIADYIAHAEALKDAPIPASSDVDYLAQWLDRAELDITAIVAALRERDAERDKIDLLRSQIADHLRALQDARRRLESGDGVAKLAAIKTKRDLGRKLPELIDEFASAQEAAVAAITRMSTIVEKLRGIA